MPTSGSAKVTAGAVPERMASRMFNALVEKIREQAASRGIEFVVAVRLYLQEHEPYPLWAGLTPERYVAYLIDKLRIEWYEDLIENLWESSQKRGSLHRKQVEAGLITGAKKKEQSFARQMKIVQCLNRMLDEGRSRNLSKLIAQELGEKEPYVRRVIATEKKRTNQGGRSHS